MPAKIIPLDVTVFLSSTEDNDASLSGDFSVGVCIDGQRDYDVVTLAELFAGCVEDAKRSDNYMEIGDAQRLRGVARQALQAAAEIEAAFLETEAGFIQEQQPLVDEGRKTVEAMVRAGGAVLRVAGFDVPDAVIHEVYNMMVTAGAAAIDNQWFFEGGAK